MSRATLLLAALLLLAACVRPHTPIPDAIVATNEAIIATNDAVKTAVMSTSEALAAGATAKARVTPTPRPGYINLRLEISDGLQPLAATVWLERMDADTLTIGPASVVTLQVPVNQPLVLTVQTAGYLDWTQALTPTQSLNLAVVMNEGP